MRSGRGRIHVGQLNRGRGRRRVGHRGTVVPGVGAVPVVRPRVGLVPSVLATAGASAAGRRRIYVRAAVRAVRRVRCGCAGPVATTSGGHAAALTAAVIV